MNSINEKPFNQVGFTGDDFVRWCKLNKRKTYVKESKIEFFNLVYNEEIIKKDNICYFKGEKF